MVSRLIGTKLINNLPGPLFCERKLLMKNELYTIGQLAKLAGISTKTLRVYERKGLLVPERNEDNSYRMYGEEAVRTLEKIQLM